MASSKPPGPTDKPPTPPGFLGPPGPPRTSTGRPTAAAQRERKRRAVELEAAEEARDGIAPGWEGGFAIVLNDVTESRAFQLLSKNEMLVYLRLCGFYNHETGRCDPGQRTLADRVGLDRETVTKAIGKLVNAGLVRRVSGAHDDGRHGAYAITAYERAGPLPERSA